MAVPMPPKTSKLTGNEEGVHHCTPYPLTNSDNTKLITNYYLFENSFIYRYTWAGKCKPAGGGGLPGGCPRPG